MLLCSKICARSLHFLVDFNRIYNVLILSVPVRDTVIREDYS